MRYQRFLQLRYEIPPHLGYDNKQSMSLTVALPTRWEVIIHSGKIQNKPTRYQIITNLFSLKYHFVLILLKIPATLPFCTPRKGIYIPCQFIIVRSVIIQMIYCTKSDRQVSMLSLLMCGV